MADDPNMTAYSRFYADPAHRIADTTKSNIAAPSIRAAMPLAQAGTDVVSDQEMTTLTGRDSHVYRSNPLGPEAPNYKKDIDPLLSTIDRKAAGAQPWTAADQQAEDQQIQALAKATGLEENMIRSMAASYEKEARARDADLGHGFGGEPSTPLKEAIGATLAKRVLHQPISPEEDQLLQANLQQFAKEEHYAPSGLQDEVAMFITHKYSDINRSHLEAAHDIQKTVAATVNGHGEAFLGQSGDRNRTDVPAIPGQGTRQTASAWFLNPDDPPPNMPPGTKEMGEFLVSLHESEHLSRRGDKIAPDTLTSGAQEQANEIDADKAVMAYLDNEHNPAAKNYWLQARQVDSFTSNVAAGDDRMDFSHDTATFLRVEQATGRQLDLDSFDDQKQALLERVRAKGNLQPTDPAYGRVRVSDTMGAVQAVLDDDKAEKDPAKKLSAMQLAEAQQFLKDATALGYKPNPNFPRPEQANNAPAAAAPAQPQTAAKPANPGA